MLLHRPMARPWLQGAGFAVMFSLVACASGPTQFQGQTPINIAGTPPPPPTTTTTNPPDTGQIDQDILKLCGLSDNEAYFAYNSAQLQTQAITPLNKVATCFISGPAKDKNLQLVGHANPRGPSEYNMQLGHSRADSIGQYLGARGLAKSRRETSSRGASDATGTDEQTWAKDRRVDILLAR